MGREKCSKTRKKYWQCEHSYEYSEKLILIEKKKLEVWVELKKALLTLKGKKGKS